MDSGFVLIILIFVIISILEGVTKKRRQRARQQQGAPPDRSDAESSDRTVAGPEARPRPSDRERPDDRPAPQAQEPARAEDMIPDDLWEILTGEKRPPREAPSPESEEEPEDQPEFEVEPEPVYVPEPAPAPSPKPARPQPVSRERRAPDPAVAVGRRRTIKPGQLEVLDLPVARPRRRIDLGLEGRDELRRAIVLREILGPPRGLEQDPLRR